jgi:hypothetical protein
MKRMDWRDCQVGERDGQINGWWDGSEVERRDGLQELIGWMDERDGS